jgi:uncharacterized membrane protein YfcA
VGLTTIDLILLLAGAFFAGLVDAVVGGGGLVQIPALFGVMPQAAPATVFGTNKLSSVFGTAFATLRYARRVEVPWRAAAPAALAAFAFSYLGAMAVTLMPRDLLRPLVFVLLVAVTIYTYVRKDLGAIDQGRRIGRGGMALALLVGAVLGFYDGFFGPGTGSFLIFIFVRMFGLDFLRASATSKIVNVSTNAAALLFFGFSGHILVAVGLAMAVFNVGGAVVGSHLAIHHGSAFVRKVFLLMASLLILKFAYDTFPAPIL